MAGEIFDIPSVVTRFNNIVRNGMTNPTLNNAAVNRTTNPGGIVGSKNGTHPSPTGRSDSQNLSGGDWRTDPRLSTSRNDDAVLTNTVLTNQLRQYTNAAPVERFVAASVLFNVLHGLAMQMTRVRRVRFIFGVSWIQWLGGTAHPVMYTTSAALVPQQALYFPIPTGNLPTVGDTVNLVRLENFLRQLRDQVNNIRRGASNTHISDIYMCHSSCHTNCHGSRSRR